MYLLKKKNIKNINSQSMKTKRTKKKSGKVITVVTALETVNSPCHVDLTVIQTLINPTGAHQSRPQTKALLRPFTSFTLDNIVCLANQIMPRQSQRSTTPISSLTRTSSFLPNHQPARPPPVPFQSSFYVARLYHSPATDP